MQKCNLQSIFSANKTGGAHSDSNGSITPPTSCLLTSNSSSSLVFGPALFVADVNGPVPGARLYDI